MNTVELLDKIQNILQEDEESYSRESLLTILNESLVFIAAEQALPDLQKTTTITSEDGQSMVAMPSDFQTRLLMVFNVTAGKNCRTCYNRQTLQRMYSREQSQLGDIEDVALEGDVLHYRKLPEIPQDLEVTYYAFPEILEEDEASEPSCIPRALHQRLLVSYVLWDIFSEIEDGIGEQKMNTQYYAEQFSAGFKMLQNAFPHVSEPRRYFPRKAKTF